MLEAKRYPSIATTNLLAILPVALLLAACNPNFSPNSYPSTSVQQAAKVYPGIIIGVRKVAIRVDATLASTTGAAAGGIAGSQPVDKTVSALGALGGAVLGGIAGNEFGHSLQDTFGYEYIVRRPNGDLLSVTQKDTIPLTVGEHVLLIQGQQARIVKDYTVSVDTDLAAAPDKPQSPNAPKPDLSRKAELSSPENIIPASVSETTSTQNEELSTDISITPFPVSDPATTPTVLVPDNTPNKTPASSSASQNDSKESATSTP